MGGNLENHRYFRRLLVGFRGECNDHPNENSGVCMFEVKTGVPLEIWGQEITHAADVEIVKMLKANKISCKHLSSDVIRCVDR